MNTGPRTIRNCSRTYFGDRTCMIRIAEGVHWLKRFISDSVVDDNRKLVHKTSDDWRCGWDRGNPQEIPPGNNPKGD